MQEKGCGTPLSPAKYFFNIFKAFKTKPSPKADPSCWLEGSDRLRSHPYSLPRSNQIRGYFGSLSRSFYFF